MMRTIFFLLLVLVSCFKKIPHQVEFSIPSIKGEFNSSDYRGKNLIVFFGFTHCPQVCPKTISTLKRLAPDLKNTEILFISVDLKRDNLESIKNYLKDMPRYFNGAGYDNESDLIKLLDQFKASYKIYDAQSESPIIDHTSSIYLLNKKHQIVEALPFDSSLSELKNHLKTIDGKSALGSRFRQMEHLPVGIDLKDCLLDKTPCEAMGVKIAFNPRPIVSNANLDLKLELPQDQILRHISLNGTEVDMGFISPVMYQVNQSRYEGKVHLPTCENPSMLWKIEMEVEKDQKSLKHIFYFKTQ